MPLVESEVARPRAVPPADVFDGDRPSRPLPPGDGGGGRWEPDGGPPLTNARLAVWMLLAAETAFFGGFVGAYLVLRTAAEVWPPLGQPRLPLGITAGNTVVLLASSVVLARAIRALRRGHRPALVRGLAGTAALGLLFLSIQGAEWVRLVRFGLTAWSGAYGAAFYTLIGVHGVHVLGALAWLGVVLALATRGRYGPRDHEGVLVCAMYWHFVVGLWPILYVLVYLL